MIIDYGVLTALLAPGAVVTVLQVFIFRALDNSDSKWDRFLAGLVLVVIGSVAQFAMDSIPIYKTAAFKDSAVLLKNLINFSLTLLGVKLISSVFVGLVYGKHILFWGGICMFVGLTLGAVGTLDVQNYAAQLICNAVGYFLASLGVTMYGKRFEIPYSKFMEKKDN